MAAPTLKEIYRQRPVVLEDGDTRIEAYPQGILLIIELVADIEKTASAHTVAKVLSSLKNDGHKVNGVYQVPYFEGVIATIIDYEYVDD